MSIYLGLRELALYYFYNSSVIVGWKALIEDSIWFCIIVARNGYGRGYGGKKYVNGRIGNRQEIVGGNNNGMKIMPNWGKGKHVSCCKQDKIFSSFEAGV